jgi:hypothetical protein
MSELEPNLLFLDFIILWTSEPSKWKQISQMNVQCVHQIKMFLTLTIVFYSFLKNWSTKKLQRFQRSVTIQNIMVLIGMGCFHLRNLHGVRKLKSIKIVTSRGQRRILHGWNIRKEWGWSSHGKIYRTTCVDGWDGTWRMQCRNDKCIQNFRLKLCREETTSDCVCVPLCVCVYFILVFWPPLRVLVCG